MSTSAAATCFVCGQEATVQFNLQSKRNRDIFGQWKKSWATSLCQVLQLSGNFESIFAAASFCMDCQEAICHAEFTVNAISRLQTEVVTIREQVNDLFWAHYESLQHEGGAKGMDNDDSETGHMGIECIITEIALKFDPGAFARKVEVHPRSTARLKKLKSRHRAIQTREFTETEGTSERLNVAAPPSKRARRSRRSKEKRDSKSSEKQRKGSIKALSSGSGSERSSTIKIASVVSLHQIPDSRNEGTVTVKHEEMPVDGLLDFSQELRELEGPLKMYSNDAGIQESGWDDSMLATPVMPKDMRDDDRPFVTRSGRKVKSRPSWRESKGSDSEAGNDFGENGDADFNEVELEEADKESSDIKTEKPKKRKRRRSDTPDLGNSTGKNNGTKRIRRSKASPKIRNPTIQNWAHSCSICYKGFELEDDLKQHEILHSPEAPYACVICSEQNWNSASSLRRHVQSAHDGKRYLCNMSPCLSSFVAFGTRREMRTHLETEHAQESDPRLFHCPDCPSKFKYPELLQRHAANHSGVRSFLCGACGKTFGSKFHLKRHEKSHTKNQLKTKCSYCTKSFVAATECEEHEKLHQAETPFRCVLCDNVFTSTIELHKHVATTHEFFPYGCPTEGCDAKFTTRPKLMYHLRSSHASKRYNCSLCPYSDYAPSGLKAHMLRHTGERAHKCNVSGCERSFGRKSHLLQHVRRAHEPEREIPFECRICGKRFHDMSGLARHEVYHGDARPFMCDICSFTFKTRRNLEKHQDVHRKDGCPIIKRGGPHKTRITQIQIEPPPQLQSV